LQEWIRRDRANQRGVKRRREPDTMGVKRSRYGRLMQVSIEHGYYGNTESYGPCPDFNAIPTPPTQVLMRSIGLLCLIEPTGFSVLYDVNRTQGLLGYLRGHGQTKQFWTRLSFVLSLNNLNFINFTDIPINTNPTRSNFYFTNQDAHREGDNVVLNKDERVSATALMRVDGPDVRVVTPEGVDRVVALNIGGQPVYFDVGGRNVPYVPRCLPSSSKLSEEPVCRDIVYLDFSTDDEDKYIVQTLDAAGNILRQWPFLYTVSEPIPLCFIDLLFTQPTFDANGIYPVKDLYPADDSIVPVQYVLKFAARSTIWRYFIVPQPNDKELEDLAIEMGDGSPGPFSGPKKTKLINGANAYLIISDEPLQLRQQSPYRFRLKGAVRHMASADGVLVARMPVAAATQVLPEGGSRQPNENYSDIYVYV
jgi:hypothetical protein